MNRGSKILVVEDELIIAENLKSILIGFDYEVAGIVSSFNDAKEMLSVNEINLALVDINLGRSEKSGIELGKLINKEYSIPFIYVTANSDDATVERAKITKPSGYIVKPFNKHTLFTSIEIALNNWSKAKKHSFIITDGQEKIIVDLDEVAFIESDNGYSCFNTLMGEKYLDRIGLTQLINDSLPNYFIQVHRSYIINLKKVNSFSPDFITIQAHKIPISRRYRKMALSKLKQIS